MTGTPSGGAIVAERYQVDPEKPLPDFDEGPAKAYAATDLRDPTSVLYALLPDPELPLRVTAVSKLTRINNNHFLRPTAWDTVDWAPDGRRRPAVVLERPRGARLFPSAKARIEPFREEALVRRFLQPMASVMEDLSFSTVAHRGIRTENLFLDGGDPERSAIMLGECVSAPSGYNQPCVYETIECAMAHPAGRGEGNPANDFYALGVTAGILLMGRNPLAGMDEEQIIELKLSSGSYSALLTNARMPTPMIEVFRGLLNDDPAERWGLEQLQLWLGGRRGSPKQQVRPSKSATALEIGGRQHDTARSVAEGLSRHWDEALQIVQDGELDDWLRRGLADEDRTEAVNTAKAFGENDETVSDVTLCRIIYALDPSGPLRMRDFRATLDGISGLLAAEFANKAFRDAFLAIVNNHLLEFFIAMNTRLRPDIIRLAGTFERLLPLLAKPDIGFGMERALYMLSPSAFCRSPLLEQDYVAELGQLMPALDRYVTAKGGTVESLMDRHIAAYVAIRMKTPIAPELRDLRDATDHFGFALPTARILAYAQEQGSSGPAPALCSAIATMLEPALERYHNRETRDLIRTHIQDVANAGILATVVSAVDDKDALIIDDYNFRVAVAEYAGTLQALERVEYERENRGALARTVASQVASLFSGIIATIVVLVTILMHMI